MVGGYSQCQLLSYLCDQTLARSHLRVEGAILAHGYSILGGESMGAQKVAGHIVAIEGGSKSWNVSTQLAPWLIL